MFIKNLFAKVPQALFRAHANGAVKSVGAQPQQSSIKISDQATRFDPTHFRGRLRFYGGLNSRVVIENLDNNLENLDNNRFAVSHPESQENK